MIQQRPGCFCQAYSALCFLHTHTHTLHCTHECRGYTMKCSSMAASAVLVLLLAGQAAASRPSKAVAPQKSTTASAVPAAVEAKKGPQDRIMFLRQLPVGPRLNSNHYSG